MLPEYRGSKSPTRSFCSAQVMGLALTRENTLISPKPFLTKFSAQFQSGCRGNIAEGIITRWPFTSVESIVAENHRTPLVWELTALMTAPTTANHLAGRVINSVL